MRRSATVIKLPVRKNQNRRNWVRPEPIQEDIFFHKSQIHIGTKLRYYGRLSPGSIWTVTGFRTWEWSDYLADYKGIISPKIVRLSDEVFLKNNDTGERHQATFTYLSYSAIWRITS